MPCKPQNPSPRSSPSFLSRGACHHLFSLKNPNPRRRRRRRRRSSSNTMQQPNNNSNHQRGDLQSLPFPEHHQQSPTQDDFLDHMLSSLPSPWGAVDLPTNTPKSPWDQPSSSSALVDDPLLLASRLSHHQISPPSSSPSPSPSSSTKPMVLQLNQQHQQLMVPSMARSGEPTLVPLPLSLANDPLAPNPNSGGADGLYNGLATPATLQRVGSGNQQHFSHPQGSGGLPSQNFGAPPAAMAQGPTASAGSGGGGGTGPPRQRVRARRGQATDPHSIAERLRRERIAERMKALQELVPNANKTDKASMLDEIIDYVKFLQLQVKVLSMSRLGGAAAVAPLVGGMSSEGASGGPRTSAGVNHPSAVGGGSSGGSDSMTISEHQVAKLMEEDMGSAMQYLQGKGLCLMPISLASAISAATGHACTPPPPPLAAALHHHHVNAATQQLLHGGGANNNNMDGSSSPSLSVLTVQSAMAAANGTAEADASQAGKDAGASVSKP